jgi:hypothetical protein
MTFKELLETLERQFGSHQFPLNPAARGIKDVFESSPLHPDLVTRLTREIFSGNRCQTLGDAVTRDDTLAALTKLRLEVLKARTTDIDARRFVDDLGGSLERIFAAPPKPAVAPTPKPIADVIEMKRFRRRVRPSA